MVEVAALGLELCPDMPEAVQEQHWNLGWVWNKDGNYTKIYTSYWFEAVAQSFFNDDEQNQIIMSKFLVKLRRKYSKIVEE